MDAIFEWINSYPDWVQTINKAYRHRVINNILMAIFSIGTFSTLFFGFTTIRNKYVSNWYALPIFIASAGFAFCMALLISDRSDLYKSWSVAMA